MPRFFFHVRSPEGLVEDPDGSEYADVAEARAEAVSSARDLWASAIAAGQDMDGASFEIADENGAHVATVPFTEALPPRLRDRLR